MHRQGLGDPLRLGSVLFCTMGLDAVCFPKPLVSQTEDRSVGLYMTPVSGSVPGGADPDAAEKDRHPVSDH